MAVRRWLKRPCCKKFIYRLSTNNGLFRWTWRLFTQKLSTLFLETNRGVVSGSVRKCVVVRVPFSDHKFQVGMSMHKMLWKNHECRSNQTTIIQLLLQENCWKVSSLVQFTAIQHILSAPFQVKRPRLCQVMTNILNGFIATWIFCGNDNWAY